MRVASPLLAVTEPVSLSSTQDVTDTGTADMLVASPQASTVDHFSPVTA